MADRLKLCPICKTRLYVNGVTHCKLCGSELTLTELVIADNTIDLFNQVQAVRDGIKTLLHSKFGVV